MTSFARTLTCLKFIHMFRIQFCIRLVHFRQTIFKPTSLMQQWSLSLLLLLLVWSSKLPQNGYSNKICLYSILLGSSHCVCWPCSLDGRWLIFCWFLAIHDGFLMSCSGLTHFINQIFILLNELIEQCILDTNAGKQLSQAATDV